MGVPTLAEGQSAHLYPIRVVLAALFDPVSAISLEVGVYLGLAGLATYLFLRELRLDPLPALLGAYAHMFGSFSLFFVRNLALHRSLWILPILFLLAERTSRSPSLGILIAASFAFGMQVLSGHPTFAIVSAVSATLYLCIRVGQTSWETWGRFGPTTRRIGAITLIWGSALGVGLGVGAAQLLPTLEHVPHSLREGGLDFDYATRSNTAGVAWMGQLFLPYGYELGDLRRTPTVFGSFYNQNPNRGFYLGALTPLLVLTAFLSRRSRRTAAALLACAGLSFVFALGGDAPLFPALRRLPGMEGLRYPQRFLGVSSLLVAGAAAIGVHALLDQEERSRLAARIGRLPAAYVLVVAVAAIVFFAGRSGLERVGIPATDLVLGLATSVGLAAAAAGVVKLVLVGRLRSRIAPFLLIGFLVSDLLFYRVIGDYAPTSPIEEATVPSEAATYVRSQDGAFRVLSLQSADGGTFSTEVLRNLLVADLPSLWGISTTDAYFSLMLGRHFVLHESLVWELNERPESTPALLSMLGAMNVRYVVSRPDVTLPGLRRAFDTDSVAVWENPEYLPRTFLVYEAVPEAIERRPDWEERAATERLPQVRSMLADWEARAEDAVIVDNVIAAPVDFRRTVVVAGAEALRLGPQGTGVVTTISSEPDRHEIQVQTDQPALLVWSESYYPGWQAELDGTLLPIYRTNYLSMGVPVPPGTHTLTFTFRTPGFGRGLAITAASTTLLMVGLSALYLARRARGATSP